MSINLKSTGKPFQENTKAVMMTRYWRIFIPAALVMGFIVGLEVAWLSENWRLFLPLTIGVSLLLLAMGRFFVGDIRPTVRCRACDAHGWIIDIVPTKGACPHCSGTQFNYDRWYVKMPTIPYRIKLSDISGDELLALRTQNDLKFI